MTLSRGVDPTQPNPTLPPPGRVPTAECGLGMQVQHCGMWVLQAHDGMDHTRWSQGPLGPVCSGLLCPPALTVISGAVSIR